MSFIIDYSKNTESEILDSHDLSKSSDSKEKNTDSDDLEKIKPIKKKLSTKKLEALAKARVKASVSIKQKNIKYKQLQNDNIQLQIDKEKEENDIVYIQEKYEYFKKKIDTYYETITENTTKHIKPESMIYQITDDDLLLAKMLEKY